MPVDPEALSALVATLRKRCPSARFATGAELYRGGAVMLEREADDEAVLAVRIPDWPTPAAAVLYPDTGEWACDCGGGDPCAHVVAAALALDASKRTGAALPSARAATRRVRYTLSVRGGGLVCARHAVSADGDATRLEGRLADAPMALDTRDADLAVDRLLDGDRVAPARLVALVEALAGCDDVRLGDVTVRAAPEPVLPRVVVDDHPKGFLLRVEAPPGVTGEVVPGLVRVGDVLRPTGAADVTGPTWTALPRTQVVPRAEVVAFVTDRLPALRARCEVEVRAKRLPALRRGMAPRVVMDAQLLPHKLSVTPAIVYGDPPCARVEKGALVHLRGDVPVRAPEAEVALAHRLRDAFGLVVGVRADYQGDDVGRFMQRMKAWSGAGDDARALFGNREVTPRFAPRDDGFELEFERPRDEGADDEAPAKADARAVVTAWREGLDVVPLTDGTWAPLPARWLSQHGERVADLLAARDADGRVAPAARPALAQLCDALEVVPPAPLARLRSLADAAVEPPPAALPDDLTATLRPYQRRGVDWLCLLREAGIGAVLADDMGLGKTLQALAAMRGRCLVVAPRSVMDNWEAEARRFRPAMRVALYHGPGRALDPRADLTLTTWAMLRADVDALAAVRWDMAVLDEAQAIKNPDSQTARAAFALRADFRVALSGTPVENRLEELWSLAHFTNPGLLGSRSDFVERVAEPVGRGDAEAARRLRARVGTFVLRRLKRDVAPELPPRTEVVLRVELTDAERAVYDAVRAATLKDVVASLRAGSVTLAALEALLRLRQAACHAGLVPGQTADTSSKLECLVDALETAAAEGHRALVFSQWTSLLDRVEPHLTSAGLAFERLDGATRDRAGVVARFQSESGPPVMLVSLKAGGTGLNLTAADHVFMLDPWWNPAVEDQAADRAHRIGQRRAVTVHRLVARDTVEERILALQATKRALAEAALDGADPSASLSSGELLALLGDA